MICLICIVGNVLLWINIHKRPTSVGLLWILMTIPLEVRVHYGYGIDEEFDQMMLSLLGLWKITHSHNRIDESVICATCGKIFSCCLLPYQRYFSYIFAVIWYMRWGGESANLHISEFRDLSPPTPYRHGMRGSGLWWCCKELDKHSPVSQHG